MTRLLATLAGTVLLPLSSAFAQGAAGGGVPQQGGGELFWLAILTLLIAVGAGFWQLQRVRRAKRRNEHTSLKNVGTHR